MKLISTGLFCGLLAASLSIPAHAADARDTARQLFTANKDAIVRVTAVVKVEMSGRGSEGQDIETCATIIGADGLAVVSATLLNPIAAALEAMDSDRMPTKPKIELTQVKYRLADSTEVPARLVYKDKDLDLAFLVPDLKDGEKPPKFTVLEVKDGPKAQELDEIISIARLAKNLSYTPSVSLGHIVAVVTKPRQVYDFALNGTPTAGTPVFTGGGELLGFAMIHRDDNMRSQSTRAFLASGGTGGEIVILPAGEVAGLVEQARKAAAKKEPKAANGDAEKAEKKDDKKE